MEKQQQYKTPPNLCHLIVQILSGLILVDAWRRGWDSNPRYLLQGTPLFESGTFNHSVTSPSLTEVIISYFA